MQLLVMPPLKVVSISHSIDPDGIGAQAILYRYFRELHIEPIGFLADYYNFLDVFPKALQEKPDVLIITDIGLNARIINAIVDTLRDLKARKIWIDHHKAPLELKKQLQAVTNEFIHDTSVCAAELVQKRFMPTDEISKQIAQISHNGDFDVDDRLTNIYYTLIDFYRFSMNDLIRIREILSSGEFESPVIMEEFLEAYKAFEAERDRIRAEHKILVFDSTTVAFAYSKLLPRGKVTKFLSEIVKADIYMAIDTNNFRIGLRSDTIDVATIAASFGGGGHHHRSGFTFKNALTSSFELSKEFLLMLEKAFLESKKKSPTTDSS